jgi:transcriptional regulator
MSENVNTLFENANNSSPDIQLKYSRQNIQLRRAEVLRLQAMGENESSIARSLGCSQALISLDVAFLKEMAKNKIAEHLGNLAYELDKVSTGLDILIKTAYSWLNAPQFSIQNTTTSTVKDRTVLLTLISNLYNMKWQLLTDKDPDAIHHAAQYVTKEKEELEKQIEYAQINWEDEEVEEEEEKENNV